MVLGFEGADDAAAIKINDGNAFEKEAIFLDVDKNGNAIVKTDQGRELISSGEISIKGVY